MKSRYVVFFLLHFPGENVTAHSDPELQFYLDQSQNLYVEDGVLKRRTSDDRGATCCS